MEVKSRQVTVKGPRGTLKRDLRNENVEMEITVRAFYNARGARRG